MDAAHVDDFDPEAVPTVGVLLQELNDMSATQPGGEHHSGKPYFRV